MKVQCNICKTPTNHEVLFEHEEKWDEEVIWGSDNWQIIRCLGCESITYRHVHFFSEDIDPDGTGGETITLFPPRGKNILTGKDYFMVVDNNIERLYKEVIDCFNIQAWTLAAAGIRAIIEGICKNEGVLSGTVLRTDGITRLSSNLDGKIAGLAERELITKRFADILHQLRFLGNEAIHELTKPSADELTLAIDIIEHTIESLYEIREKADSLKKAMEKKRAK